VKAKLRTLNSVDCQQVAEKAINLPSTEDVICYIASLN
jgi:hypothetical protein